MFYYAHKYFDKMAFKIDITLIGLFLRNKNFELVYEYLEIILAPNETETHVTIIGTIETSFTAINASSFKDFIAIIVLLSLTL